MKKIFISNFIFFLVTMIVLSSISLAGASISLSDSIKDMVDEIGKIIMIITFITTTVYAFLVAKDGIKCDK